MPCLVRRHRPFKLRTIPRSPRLGLATGMGPARTNSTGIPVPRWWVLYSVSPICGRLIEVARAIDGVDQFLPRLSLPKTQSGVGRRGPPMGRGTGVSVGEAKVCRWRGLGHARPEVAALAGTVRCRGKARRLNRNSGHARPSDPLHSGRWACASGGASILMMKTADVRKSNDLTAVG